MLRRYRPRIATLCLLSFFLTALFLFAACSKGKTADAEQHKDTEAPAQSESLSKVEEQALTGALQISADEQITEENAKEEAAKLEKEIEADLN